MSAPPPFDPAMGKILTFGYICELKSRSVKEIEIGLRIWQGALRRADENERSREETRERYNQKN
jgi:hypothetical protein